MKNKPILPPTYILSAMLLMAVLHFLLPAARVIVFPWTLLGMVPIVLGLVLNLLADNAFKKHKTTVKPFQKSTFLVTDGVFRISRHPMYLGFVLILLGTALCIGSLTPFAVIIIFAVVMDIVFIRVEERMLEETFGDAWLAYKRKARRWL